MESEFVPDLDERHLAGAELGVRWNCHPKTAARRFKELGGAALLMGGSVLYPLSQIIAIERESVSRFAARKTQKPPQFVAADRRRKERREEQRLVRLVRRQKHVAGGQAAEVPAK
jgi:hypothetical protein